MTAHVLIISRPARGPVEVCGPGRGYRSAAAGAPAVVCR
jgi:hypothetical protein